MDENSKVVPNSPKIPEEISDTAIRRPIPPFEDRIIEESYYYNSRSRKRRRADKMQNSRAAKRQRTPNELGNLFHNFGSMDSAKNFAQNGEKWLIINMERSLAAGGELYGMLLDEANVELKNLFLEHFIVWEVFQNTTAGQQYKNFYGPVTRFPYVAILDPATAEKLAECHGFESSELSEFLEQFLSGIPQKENSGKLENTLINPDFTPKTENSPSSKEGNKSKFLFLIRFPDGKRHITTWPVNTPLQSLLLYINENGFRVQNLDITALHPRRILPTSDPTKTFEQAHLFCREVLILQEKTVPNASIA